VAAVATEIHSRIGKFATVSLAESLLKLRLGLLKSLHNDQLVSTQVVQILRADKAAWMTAATPRTLKRACCHGSPTEIAAPRQNAANRKLQPAFPHRDFAGIL
jgi:hypothetical protein